MISPPLDCSAALGHGVMPAVVQTTCTTVTFQGTTAMVGDTALNSTLMITADINMNGSIIECIAGSTLSGTSSVGNISLYIVGELIAAVHVYTASTVPSHSPLHNH